MARRCERVDLRQVADTSLITRSTSIYWDLFRVLWHYNWTRLYGIGRNKLTAVQRKYAFQPLHLGKRCRAWPGVALPRQFALLAAASRCSGLTAGSRLQQSHVRGFPAKPCARFPSKALCAVPQQSLVRGFPAKPCARFPLLGSRMTHDSDVAELEATIPATAPQAPRPSRARHFAHCVFDTTRPTSVCAATEHAAPRSRLLLLRSLHFAC